MKKKFYNTVNNFGDEWEKFNNINEDNKKLRKIFNAYFRLLPKKFIKKNKICIDIGSGSGRWANFLINKIKKIYLLEPSEKAINVSKKRYQKKKNIIFINKEIKNLNTKNNYFDFAYSLGVLHHISYPKQAFKIINKKLKKNSPFLVYLYHDFEENSFMYKLIWKLSEILRKFISQRNFYTKSLICEIIAVLIYYPLAKISSVLKKINISTKNFPLNYYYDKSFYVMRNDALDRFGTKFEKRYSKKNIIKLFKETGFKNIKISSKSPYWCAIGYKK